MVSFSLKWCAKIESHLNFYSLISDHWLKIARKIPYGIKFNGLQLEVLEIEYPQGKFEDGLVNLNLYDLDTI